MAFVGKHSFSWTAPSAPFLLPCLAGLSRSDSCQSSAPGIVKLVTAGGNTTGNCQAQPRASSRSWHLQGPSQNTHPGHPQRKCWDLVLQRAHPLPPGMACLICFKALGGFPLPKVLENGLINTFQSDAFHGYPSSGKTDGNSPAFCLSERDAPNLCAELPASSWADVIAAAQVFAVQIASVKMLRLYLIIILPLSPIKNAN